MIEHESHPLAPTHGGVKIPKQNKNRKQFWHKTNGNKLEWRNQDPKRES